MEEHVIVLTGGRASGKTSAMIRWVMENPQERGILCLDRRRAEHIVSMMHRAYPDFQWEWKNNVITVEYMERRFSRGVGRGEYGPFREIGIDDAEEVLSRLFGSRVEMAAMNATWIPLDQRLSDNNDRVVAYVEAPISIDTGVGEDIQTITFNEEPRRR